MYSVSFNTTSAGVYTIFSGATTFTHELLSLTAGTPGLPLGGLSDVANCLPGQYISGISGAPWMWLLAAACMLGAA